MVKIGILSDTHGHTDERMLHYLSGCDEVWHGGDWGNIQVEKELNKICPILRGVYGNIDGNDIRSVYKEDAIFYAEEMKVWIRHIGGYPGRYSHGVDALMQQLKPDIFISGHSHILKVMPDKKYNLIHINPGAAGHHGFHKKRTLILLEISGKKITKMNAVELGERKVL